VDDERITEWLVIDLATALGSEVEVKWLSPSDIKICLNLLCDFKPANVELV
jgi:hypothetical protein